MNYTRALETTADDPEQNKKLTIVDVEKENEPPVASTSSATVVSDPYVYDLYVSETSEAVLQYPDNIDDLRLVLLDDLIYSFSTYI